MRSFGTIFRLVAIFVITNEFGFAYSAEIGIDSYYKSGFVSLYLEGEILPGDFEKLKNVIVNNDGARDIYLASPGGDLSEAMKIGRLIRSLKISTTAPRRIQFCRKPFFYSP
jgi:hypothetical protein